MPGFLRDPADLFRTWGASDGVYSVIIPDFGGGAGGSTTSTAAASAASIGDNIGGSCGGDGDGDGGGGNGGGGGDEACSSGGAGDGTADADATHVLSKWGHDCNSIGLWLKRDHKTGDVVCSWVEPGGAAERAGVAAG